MPVFRFRNSVSTGITPNNGGLLQGELAVNITDQRMFHGNNAATTVKISDTLATQASNAVSISGGTVSVTNLGTTTAATVKATTLTVGGTSVTTVGTTYDVNSNSAVASNSAVLYGTNRIKGKLKNIFTFTTNGTYTKSGNDVQRIHVVMCGGGGGGRAYSECGGAGGYAEAVIDATSITTVAVTVGGAGSGGAYFGFSPGGGTTSFGAYLTATGGTGANAHIQHNGGLGGLGSLGSGTIGGFGTRGGGGGGHNNMDQYSPNCAPGGEGGISFYGGGTPGAHQSTVQPAGVAAYGAGGVAVSPSHNGQGGRNGREGICIVYEYK